MIRRYPITLALFALIAVVSVACVQAQRPASQQRDSANTEEQQSLYQTRQPVPRFDWSQERDTLIQIYVLRQEARATFTTFHSNGTGDVIFACPSRGYGIPGDTQLTNPVQPYGAIAANYPLVTIDQPEPNGLYSSANTDGTWVLCVRENGEVAPVYSELKVQTFPFEVSWDETRRMLLDMKKQASSSLTVRTRAPGASPSPVPTLAVP